MTLLQIPCLFSLKDDTAVGNNSCCQAIHIVALVAEGCVAHHQQVIMVDVVSTPPIESRTML